jgi:hypothetical protein
MMSDCNCRPGDLAVVISARFPTNLGRIVKVIRPDDSKGDIRYAQNLRPWLVESAQPMTWHVGKQRLRRKRGPVPDAQLKPIRGYPPAQRKEALHTPLAAVTEKVATT